MVEKIDPISLDGKLSVQQASIPALSDAQFANQLSRTSRIKTFDPATVAATGKVATDPIQSFATDKAGKKQDLKGTQATAKEKDPKDKNTLTSFIRIKIGDLEYSSSEGAILERNGTPVIRLSSYMHSYAEIIIYDPDDKEREKISKHEADEVQIEIGFAEGERINKLVAKLYRIGRSFPDGTLIELVDPAFSMQNNTGSSVQGNNEKPNTTSPTKEEGITEEKVVKTLQGKISWYGPGFEGKPTASGAKFDPNAMTCASKELPFGTRIKITVKSKTVVVTVNDRGPYIPGRDLDVSRAAADALGITSQGEASAKIEILAKVPAKQATAAPPSKALTPGVTPANATDSPALSQDQINGQPPTLAGQKPNGTAEVYNFGVDKDLSAVLQKVNKAASGGKGQTQSAELFASDSGLKFTSNTNFAIDQSGTVRVGQSPMTHAMLQAQKQGDVVVTRGNTVSQVGPGQAPDSGVVIDYKKNLSAFCRQPTITKKTSLQLAGAGALTVQGWDMVGKQMVGATVVTPGATPNGPASIQVPEVGEVKGASPIYPGGRFTWNDATKNMTRKPATKQILQNIAAIAQVMDQLEKQYNTKLQIASWYRDPESNRLAGGVANSQHLIGNAVDFSCDNESLFQKIFRELDASWNGGIGDGRAAGHFIHVDLAGRRRWTY